jgi:Putative prokaryotic signal transducing protein
VDDDAVRLTKVPGEPEAEMLCMHLRNNGLECAYRPTQEADSAFEGFGGLGGMLEVLVHQKDLERARELLPEHGA